MWSCSVPRQWGQGLNALTISHLLLFAEHCAPQPSQWSGDASWGHLRIGGQRLGTFAVVGPERVDTDELQAFSEPQSF